MTHAVRRLCGLAGGTALLFLPTGVFAQDSKSTPLVAELAKLMEQAKADSIAAHYPGVPDQFVAALFFRGSQLLVVTAKYAAPVYLTEKFAKKAYRDIYVDLSSASVPNTKVFISDLGADGLKPRRLENAPFDTAEIRGKTTVFDGEWEKAKLSEQDYMTAFADADDAYVTALKVLIDQLKKPS
jgi:hypothetical protein